MKNMTHVSRLMTSLMVISFLLAPVATVSAKSINLKVPVCFNSSLPVIGDSALWLAENIETASNGSIKMKIYEPGKLLPPSNGPTVERTSPGRRGLP